MRIRIITVLLFIVPALAHGQNDQWRVFARGAAFGTFASAAGISKEADTGQKVFSTNWFEAGAERALSSDSSVLFRGRVSAEPLTIPREGYTQLLQYVSPPSGGTGVVDRMRAHDLIEELAVQATFRSLHLYLAPVGDAPIGPGPFAQRKSAVDFAEAPFAYDVSESIYKATKVVAAGFTSAGILVEAGVFHHAVTTGRHTTIDNGTIDSRSARITFGTASKLSAQVSYGELGPDHAEKVTTASASYNGTVASTTLSWVRRKNLTSLDAGGIETALHLGRSTLLARLEAVDRPAGFLGRLAKERTTHLTLGYIYDILNGPSWRAGLGANVDYHTQSGELQQYYEHKPQTVYAFARVRLN
jgi:hypothetical protein